MAYIKETISNYGTQLSYLTALRDFFVNNGVAPFELISDLDEENLSFTVERNNLNLTFSLATSSTSTHTMIDVSSKVNDDTYSSVASYYVEHCQSENWTTSIGRELQALLVKNEDTILLQIAPWNAVAVSRGTTILDCPLSNGVNLIGSGRYATATTIPLKETSTQNTYTVRPFHTGSNDETSIILSNTLAVNTSSGVYFADSLGLKSAGGAKQFGYYVTNSDTYYGVFADVAIPLGDRIEYTSEVTV